MITRLLRTFLPQRVLWDLAHATAPSIRGHVTLETREGGKLREVREGHNIWTLTGREYIAELIGLESTTTWATGAGGADAIIPDGFRHDRIAYIGMGSGAQAEVSNITGLVSPVPYVSAQFLAALVIPATFPAASGSTTNTSIRFTREFSRSEISLGYNVVLTEAGLFTNGNPASSWALPAPTAFSTASTRAPMAYKTFEPITKTTSYTLKVIWDVRII